jgi:hypothetical protein|tara:strand:+ start:2999 stop:3157 length:159 start_codon:yes stop_codon:yes gene_type:complete
MQSKTVVLTVENYCYGNVNIGKTLHPIAVLHLKSRYDIADVLALTYNNARSF